jgi:oxygen-independent coproporphyrinogen-3 oxidase
VEFSRALVTQPISSIFIGGGTPTVLTGAQLRRLWAIVDTLPRQAGAEVSIEVNPGTLTPDVLDALAAMPLTRVSLGAQSLQPDELAALGRIHTPEAVAEAVAAARALPGAVEVNIDLMYGLPGQTPASWAATLDGALALRPEHLSLYALIVEDGTPLAVGVAAGAIALPGEEEEMAMEDIASERLGAADYAWYEVSNAARPGRHCRHNLGYWLGRDYLGLGPAAVSALGGVRWRNTPDVAVYADRAANGRPVVCYSERLRGPERLLERVMLGLRLRAGFDLAAAEAACGCRLAEITGPALDALRAEGLLEWDGTTLRLSPAGYPLANAVLARLMAAAHTIEGERG